MITKLYLYIAETLSNALGASSTKDAGISSLVVTIAAFLVATICVNVMKTFLEFGLNQAAIVLGRDPYTRPMPLTEALIFVMKRIYKKIYRFITRESIDQASDTAIRTDTLPAAYLEADETDLPHPSELRIPELLHQCIKIFGKFDDAFVHELCKSLRSRIINSGMLVFQPGDPYDNIFIVHTGRLRVYILQMDGAELTLRIVHSGECIVSMLSFIDVVRGETSHVLALWGQAELDTVILQVPLTAFRDILRQRADLLSPAVQLIATRLHRINFTALYHYMGMNEELVNPLNRPGQIPKYSYMTAPVLTSDGMVRSLSQCQLTASVSSTASSMVSVDSLPPFRSFREAFPPATSFPPHQSTSNILDPEENGVLSPVKTKQSREFQHTVVTDTDDNRESLTQKDSSEESDKDEQPMDYGELAKKKLGDILGLEDETLLENMIEIRDFPSGTFVLKDQTDRDVSLIYVIQGPLIVMQRLTEPSEQPIIFIAAEGELVGGLSVISGERISLTVSTEETSKVAVVSRSNVLKLITMKPEVVLHIMAAIAQRLSLFVRQIDFALDWMQLESGKALFRQGEPSTCMYIVLSGRLRSVMQSSNSRKHIIKEYGKGDLVGIAEMLAEQERYSTVIAVRDTELVKMPAELLKTINILHPGTMQNLMRKLGTDILGSMSIQRHGFPMIRSSSLPTSHISMLDAVLAVNGYKFSTVAVLPLSSNVPVSAFTAELYFSIKPIGTVLRLTKESVTALLGPTVLEYTNESRLSSWLGHQEDKHKVVLYQCENELSIWTRRCLRQADIILLVVMADDDPKLTKIELSLDELAVRTQKELVLLHRDGSLKPKNTIHWLTVRPLCSFHHHIRCPKRMFHTQSQEKLNELYIRVFEFHPNIHSDFSRLARFLTGTSVGLVLGGGGARGAAHIGIIQAMIESNIPVDMIGGVSIGAFMGALWCMEHSDLQNLTYRARKWSLGMTPWWKQVIDVTFPFASLLTGKYFNKCIREVFEDTQVEDLWLPYFCVTTDICDSNTRSHFRGSLWRYVRASMTLAGYLPPLCDPVDGHYLLDGGYSNILPADVMQNKGRVQTILAIDVSKHDEINFTNYGDSLSGFRILFHKINPWGKSFKVLNLPDIQSRLALASGVRALEQVRQSASFHYIRPPVNNYEMLEFALYEEVKDIGYAFAKELFLSMKSQGNLPGPYNRMNSFGWK